MYGHAWWYGELKAANDRKKKAWLNYASWNMGLLYFKSKMTMGDILIYPQVKLRRVS